jgi:hypothetical protein
MLHLTSALLSNTFLISPTCATCPAHLILLGLSFYYLMKNTNYAALHCTIPCPLLLQIFSSVHFLRHFQFRISTWGSIPEDSHLLSLCYFLNVTDQVSLPYKSKLKLSCYTHHWGTWGRGDIGPLDHTGPTTAPGRPTPFTSESTWPDIHRIHWPSEGKEFGAASVPWEIKRCGHNSDVQNATRGYVLIPASGCTTQGCPLRTVRHDAGRSGTQI